MPVCGCTGSRYTDNRSRREVELREAQLHGFQLFRERQGALVRRRPEGLETRIQPAGGIRTSPNKVFGLGVGRSSVYYDAYPAHAYRVNLYLYHRHYLPIDKHRRFSLYSDLIGGGSYVYKVSGYFDESHTAPTEVGKINWWFSWQPGLSIRLWGKSNIFFGPTIGPSYGVHLGIAI